MKIIERKEVKMTDDGITINNAIGLLEELIDNGDNGRRSLIAWFLSERNLIENTIFHLKEHENNNQ